MAGDGAVGGHATKPGRAGGMIVSIKSGSLEIQTTELVGTNGESHLATPWGAA